MLISSFCVFLKMCAWKKKVSGGVVTDENTFRFTVSEHTKWKNAVSCVFYWIKDAQKS